MTDSLTNQPERSSPTRRTAAYPSDIELVGRSQAFVEMMNQVERVANTNLPVLLTGEPGTGKRLVAAAIHKQSERAAHPFVKVNCGTLAADVLEAELFGYVEDASIGHDRDRSGLWEEADGGTVFLEDITDADSSLQVKLLHALQTGEIQRVGSNQTIRPDVRVIVSSYRDVAPEVAAGRFRNDLFDRLNSVSIGLPPLRERPEDIPPLAQSFADRVYSLSPSVKFSGDALTLLERYNWPGNIRELESVVVRAAALSDGTIRVKDLPQRVRLYLTRGYADDRTNGSADPSTREDWVPLSEIEGRYVARVLEHTKGNKQAAARVLGVDRKTLDRMIKRHNIETQSLRDRAKSSTADNSTVRR